METTELERVIDTFIADLKKQLLNPSNAPKVQRSVWDRVKNWWANVKQGRDNAENPYYYQNKLGDYLGSTTENTTIKEYRVLKEQANKLDSLLLEVAPPQNLQLLRTIDNWGQNFKKAIVNMVAGKEVASQVSTPEPEKAAPVAVEPEKVPEPVAPPTPTPVATPTPTAPPIPNYKRKWADLAPEEQANWDKKGGGLTVRKDVSRSMKMIGIDSLPWILRIGDPRIKELKGQKRENLIKQHRIESIYNPISDAEWPQALERAKKGYQDFIANKSSKNLAAWKTRRSKLNPTPTEAPVTTPVQPEPVITAPPVTSTPTPEVKPPEVKQPKIRKTKAKAVKPEPEVEDKFRRQARLQSEIEALEGIEDDKIIELLKEMLADEQFDDLESALSNIKINNESLTWNQRTLLYKTLLRRV